jgi:uncharacterized protein YtpQ (UPF0354 family)
MKAINRLLGRPDLDDLAKIVIQAIRRTGALDSIDYDPVSGTLVASSGATFYLRNFYYDYYKAPRRQRRSVLDRYVAAWTSLPKDMPSLEDALPTLLPVVRTASFQDLIRLRSTVEGLGEKVTVPSRALAGHLAVTLACDAPKAIRYVSDDDLSSWDLTFDDALERARDNLWQKSGGKFDRPVSGFYASPWHDSYDSSRLFLYDLIWHLDVDGDHVAAVPNRDLLLVTGSNNLAGLAVMAKMCEQALDESRPLSSIPVILQGKLWKTFLPEPGHPHYELFKKLQVTELSRDYAEQSRVLEAWTEQAGEDVFVAGYQAISDKERGAYSSYCVWSEGVPTFLPAADDVAFVVGGKFAGTAPWDRVCAVASHLMTSLDLHPPRFKVQAFPSPDQIASLELNRNTPDRDA